MTLTPVDLGELKNKFKEIEEKVRDKILDFYVTVCPKCGRKAIVLASIWRITEPNPFELRLLCLNCNKKFKKSPTEDDILKLREVEHEKPCWYPENKLKYPNGVEFKEGTHKTEIDSIDKLFTKRNLISLSLIYREIESIDDELHRDMFKFAFTSMVHLASKLCPVAKPSERAHWSEFSATSFWAQHRYWIPPIFMESNVWMLFESAFYGRQGLLKGKEDSNENISYLKEAKKFEDFEKGANILISTQSALDLSNIPDNSVDYVFTDPPYGGGYTIF
jgi:adenine-specific DNA methylase